jgi:hypothetical protein
LFHRIMSRTYGKDRDLLLEFTDHLEAVETDNAVAESKLNGTWPGWEWMPKVRSYLFSPVSPVWMDDVHAMCPGCGFVCRPRRGGPWTCPECKRYFDLQPLPMLSDETASRCAIRPRRVKARPSPEDRQNHAKRTAKRLKSQTRGH